MQNVHLAYVIDRIKQRFGRMNNVVKARLTGDLNDWINRLCRRYHFWFLQVEPSARLIQSFPLSTTATNFTSLTPVKGSWVDKGWLLVEANKVEYLFADPTIEEIDYTLVANPPTSYGSWYFTEIAKINYVKQFDACGAFVQDLAVVSWADLQTFANYSKTGQPCQVAFRTVNNVSILHFMPTPDAGYLYTVNARLATLPPLDRPDATNALLMRYPDVAIMAGIFLAAQYFNEKGETEAAGIQLYGQTFLKESDPTRMTPGGMIGDMLVDSRARHSTSYDTMPTYTSAKRAHGRGGIGRRAGYGFFGGPL